MKNIRFLLFATMLFCIIVSDATEVMAMSTGFSVQAMSADEERWIRNKEFIVLQEEPKTAGIKCFDINDDGMIALGFSKSDEKCISIYDRKGVFQYGYRFDCPGNYGIEWNNENIIIYFVRGDYAFELDPYGEVVRWAKIQRTIENNKYWNYCVYATNRTVGDTQYMIKNDMGFLNFFATSYSQLSAIDSNGEETLLYDVNQIQMAKEILAFFTGIAILCGVVSILIGSFKEIFKRQKTD